MTASPAFRRAAFAATVLALCVVMLGAYVRLSDAGLGCPDWPGCYGHIGVPDHPEEVAAANAAFPERPVETGKGWKEMIHRYLAGVLGLLILGLAIASGVARKRGGRLEKLPLVLLTVVVFQAILGMWTVTWQLKPVIVMAHLLGGLATLSLLWWLTLRRLPMAAHWRLPSVAGLRPALAVAMVLLIGQIALGGWTSANYAALACNEFPTCSQGQWIPPADFGEGFVLWRGLGQNYEFGVLDNPARVAIHLAHRFGALAVAVFLLGLTVALWRLPGGAATRGAAVLSAALVLQVLLGIANVVFNLPLGVAVAHNGGAAILLLTLVTLNYLAGEQRLARTAGPVRNEGRRHV
ncbi:COX15/CtaA family protein [Ectothiorhodospiraceae bacterium WFHF3C12]|nr:COX15/CtaA family protein [Ectothiorhodospiraceae bacterium WFHF3C12]